MRSIGAAIPKHLISHQHNSSCELRAHANYRENHFSFFASLRLHVKSRTQRRKVAKARKNRSPHVGDRTYGHRGYWLLCLRGQIECTKRDVPPIIHISTQPGAANRLEPAPCARVCASHQNSPLSPMLAIIAAIAAASSTTIITSTTTGMNTAIADFAIVRL